MFWPPTVTASDAGRRRAPPHCGHLAHVALDLLAGAVGLGVRVAALEPRDHALERGVVRAAAPVAVPVLDVDLARPGPEQDRVAVALAQPLPRRVDGEAVLVGDGLEDPVEVAAAKPGPRCDGAVGQAQVVVGDHELRVDLEAGAEPVAALAGAVRRVEGEVPGRELVERDPTMRAGEVLGEGEDLRLLALARHDLDLGHALGQAQRGLQ
jgi:hypothetical protein